MRIREFTSADLEPASRLWDAAEGMSAPPRQEVERKLARDPHLFLVAEDAGKLLGVAMGTYDGRRGFIFRLTVDPSHRRRGIGSALVSELEHRFDEMGVGHVRILVLGSNEGARSFWDRLGYDVFEDIVMFTKDW